MLLVITWQMICICIYTFILHSGMIIVSADSIFLLGDSISEKIYTFGLVKLLNCTIVDPHIRLFVESSMVHPQHTGYLCNNMYGIDRIGFSIHWGVALHPPYHSSWDTHRFPNSSIHSRTNIMLSLNEFINRVNSSIYLSGSSRNHHHHPHHIYHQSDHHNEYRNSTAYILFLSNLWDGKRYEDYKHSYSNPNQFLREYFYGYTTMAIRMMTRLEDSENIQLVLSTMHKISPTCDKDFMNLGIQMNIRIKRIGSFLEIPIFDQYSLLGENTTNYLADCIHQNDNEASLFLAQNIIDHHWNITTDISSTIAFS